MQRTCLGLSTVSLAVLCSPLSALEWITVDASAPPLVRKEFEIPGAVKQARLRIVGLGHHAALINGRRIDDSLFSQAWSQYDKTIYGREFNVAPLLKTGRNCVGVMLGNSFWHHPGPAPGRYHKGGAETNFGPRYLLMFVLEVTLSNGDHITVPSDDACRTALGPVTFSDIYGGEDYDARLEPAGWASSGFDDKAWKPVTPAAAPPGKIDWQFWPPIRAKEVFPMKDVRRAGDEKFHVFFGQNASGIVRFTVSGAAGASFTLEPSEYRTEAGEFMKPRWGSDPVLFRYTLKGGGPETHEWLFHYSGFQAVEMIGAVPAGQPNPKNLPVVERMELVHTRTDLPQVGQFKTSSELYNRTQTLIDWAMRSNMSYVMTDCPHREKLGWLECAYLLAPTFCYRYDGRDWFAKIARDIRDAQAEDGRIGTVAPRFLQLPYSNPYAYTVEWGAAGVLMPWALFEWTGDRSQLAASYRSMKAFVDQIESVSPNGIAPAGLGDWYDYGHGNPPGPSRYTPTDLTATAVWAMCAHALAKAADVLGKPEDAARYEAMRARIGASFRAKFYDPVTKTCANRGSPQTANAIALCADLIPAEDRATAVDVIVADLEARDYQQTSGDVGHVFLIRALAEAGRSDVLHKVYSRTGLGSYGGILAKGLTALPESWDALTVGSNSLNHCMLGHAMEWFHGWVLGIRQAPGSAGWREVLVAPNPGSLSWAKGYLFTPRGRIEVSWKRRGDGLDLDLGVVQTQGMAIRVLSPDGKPTTDLGGGRFRIAGLVP